MGPGMESDLMDRRIGEGTYKSLLSMAQRKIPVVLHFLDRLHLCLIYVLTVLAPALAYTHASSSKQALQLSQKAAPPALCLSVYTLTTNRAILCQDVAGLDVWIAFSGHLGDKAGESLPRCVF